MPKLVELSAALIDSERNFSARDDRSLAGQVEYRAQLGGMIEPSLPSANVQPQKLGEAAFADALLPWLCTARRCSRHSGRTADPTRSNVTRGFAGRGQFGADPVQSGFVIRLGPNGTRTVGPSIEDPSSR
jgi:hypothetical protein